MPDPTPDRWRLVRDAFDAVADLPPDQRDAALDDLDLDIAARAEVEAMLDADAGNSVLDTGAHSAAAAIVGEADEPTPAGERFGPWAVVREVGRGGMGAVYLVERADGSYTQQAALKRVSLGGEDGARRFERERQILAELEHPGIARLLDGGVRGETPYLVMEYVEGEPITTYADQRQLATHDRVRLFAEVCEAVGHAHRHLVVHRDLKPSNVLVAEDERQRSRPVLLDFGIAKLLDEERPEVTTRTALPRLTPEYAAPEQVTGEAVTTATDVYALGVLLYELLAGTRPYEVDTRTLSGVVQAVTEARPSRPSDSAPDDRQRAIRGDLDTVVLKALAKEPARRYGSADDLAADLRRFLDGLPVEAQTPSVGYRARRFVGRHTAGVATAALAVLVLVAGVTFYTVRLAAERDRAAQAAAEAEAVTETIVELFDRDPFAADADRMDTLSVGQFVVERGESTVTDLQGQPAVQARLLPLLARLNFQLGDAEQALVYASQGAALADSLDPRSEATLRAQTELGTVLAGQGDYEQAAVHFRRAVGLSQAIHGRDHETTATALGDLAIVLADMGDSTSIARAIELGQDALDAARRVFGPDHVDVAQAHNNLGTFLYSADRPEEAIPHIERALEIRKSALGRHPLVANSQSNLASFLRDLGRHDEAVVQYDGAIEVYRSTVGPEHPQLAAPHYGRAVSLIVLGRLSEAEVSAREALARDADALPEGHPFLAYDHELLGDVLTLRGQWAEAERHLRRAIELYGPDADDVTLADARAALGRVAARTGRTREARQLLAAAQPHVGGPRLERVEEDLAGLGVAQ
ncbi:MAG: serine/threonine-protein kinase [Bacteroidota bacterium]